MDKKTKWIWSKNISKNQHVLFVKNLKTSELNEKLKIKITAAYHYEIFINGKFISRGPVSGSPDNCLYDELSYDLTNDKELNIAVIVNYYKDTHIHYLLPTSTGGFAAKFTSGDFIFWTDETWKCLDLEMWNEDVSQKCFMINYLEDYDARKEPEGWDNKFFTDEVTESWNNADLIPDAEKIWSNYESRTVPYLKRKLVTSKSFQAYKTEEKGAEKIEEISIYCEKEKLDFIGEKNEYNLEVINTLLKNNEANVFAFDLEKEHIGFYYFEIEAPEGTIIEFSGAEAMKDGRPWIYRIDTLSSARYISKGGRQKFISFTWDGFRYIHFVIRNNSEKVRIIDVGCVERKASIKCTADFKSDDYKIQKIFELCKYTLEISAQEHLIDCPTREQSQYWGDALFVAESLWKGFSEKKYFNWFLDCYINVPFYENGQISCVYPGATLALLDYSLIPLIGQVIHKEQTGEYYRAKETFDKAMEIKKWYNNNKNAAGLIDFDYKEYFDKELVNFIDHPGIGWASFPHKGIERDGTSCPLNTFYYGFVKILSEMAEELGEKICESLKAEAKTLKENIRKYFFDGVVFHDVNRAGVQGEGTSWQTNFLAVYFEISEGAEAKKALLTMLENFETLCRTCPYFYFFNLPAMKKAGLQKEAVDLIKKMWWPMIERDATTAWEGFGGTERDSYCHPWSTAPFLFFLGEEKNQIYSII